MADDFKVSVDGLKETRKALRGVSKDLPRQLTKAVKTVATETADEARGSAQSQGGALGKAASGIKAGASAAAAYISLDTNRYPFIAGGEFGGGKHGRGNPTSRGGYTTQFKPFRRPPSVGYAVWPTIRRRFDENRRLVERQITDFLEAHDLT